MAIYHFTVGIVRRSQGQSAVAKAAYNARAELQNEQTGQTHDYTRAEGLLFEGIFAPKDAPEWARDRERLWNEAEKAEKRKDAQLARNVEIGLPYELTDEQREQLLKDFVRENFVRKGMVADVTLHAPDRGGDERNFHAHVLLTMRRIGPEGFEEEKAREWNAKAQLQTWRENWERTANRYLERHGHAARIDHRSLEAQGIDREPTQHLGPYATQLEREGKGSERGAINREIEAGNREAAQEQERRALETQHRAAELEPVERAMKKAAIQSRNFEEFKRLLSGAGYSLHQAEGVGVVALDKDGHEITLDEATLARALDRETLREINTAQTLTVEQEQERRALEVQQSPAQATEQPTQAPEKQKPGYEVLHEAAKAEQERRDVIKKREEMNAQNIEKIHGILTKSDDGLGLIIGLQNEGYDLGKNARGQLVAVAKNGFEYKIQNLSNNETLNDLEAKTREGLIVQTAAEIREERRKAKEEREKSFRSKQKEIEEAKEKWAALAPSVLYDRGDMASQQTDALRHHKAHIKAQEAHHKAQERQEEQQKREAEAEKRKRAEELTRRLEEQKKREAAKAEQERRAKAIEERRLAHQREQVQRAKEKESFARRPDQKEQKREEARARTEQTEATQRQTQKEIMRELFERQFGKGHNENTREKWERGRER